MFVLKYIKVENAFEEKLTHTPCLHVVVAKTNIQATAVIIHNCQEHCPYIIQHSDVALWSTR